MFKIPLDNDINILDESQKKELCISITNFVKNYMSDNRLSQSLKSNIELDKYLDIRYNLLTSDLIDRIKNGEIEISRLPWLEPHQLNIKLWKQHIDRQNLIRETKEMMATVNIFKCRKCGEMKCTTYQLQTASADEPMTTFISCKVCGNSWKTR